MATALVLGYSAFDLGLFSDKDPRLKLIKKAIRKDLEAMAADGVSWLVFTGRLGFRGCSGDENRIRFPVGHHFCF